MNGLEQTQAMKKLSESSREEQARKNRERFPITASMFEDIKNQIIQEFGKADDDEPTVKKTDEVMR